MRSEADVAGQKWHMLTAVRFSHAGTQGRAIWVFRCDCGTEKTAMLDNVSRGNTKSCGCYRAKRVAEANAQITDLAGYRNGMLTAVRFARKDATGRQVWVFRCDCGTETTRLASSVKALSNPNCGCRVLGSSRARVIKHKYRLTVDETKNLISRAETETCEICGCPCANKGRLSIDHCHTTNAVRGLLCDDCNVMLGRAKDSPATLRKAADYLDRFYGVVRS